MDELSYHVCDIASERRFCEKVKCEAAGGEIALFTMIQYKHVLLLASGIV